jgi:hypothetical protein
VVGRRHRPPRQDRPHLLPVVPEPVRERVARVREFAGGRVPLVDELPRRLGVPRQADEPAAALVGLQPAEAVQFQDDVHVAEQRPAAAGGAAFIGGLFARVMQHEHRDAGGREPLERL